MSTRLFLAVLVAALIAAACGRPVISDPRQAALRYAEAIEREDARAIYAMLTEDSRRAYGQDGVRRLLKEAPGELARQAKTVASERAEIQATAEVPFSDGERAVLVIQDGQFRVGAAGALPAAARTPAQALDELRQVLARRSYPGLVRVLSTETRGALERDLRSLVLGLEKPETLEIEQQGDRAEVEIPGGHKVWLKREAGVWRIHDFE